MKKLFVEYNPYKVITKITCDGKDLPRKSILLERSRNGIRLQEWVEQMPELLVHEFNSKDFEITFHGTELDYEDLYEVLVNASKENVINEPTFNYQRAQEISDKIQKINSVFKKIQLGPIKELKSENIKNAFQHSYNKEFDMCVVATMSAGKSTLINALIQDKLMPSKQESCTAIITRIIDNNNLHHQWDAVVHDKNNRARECKNIHLEQMKEWNDSADVSMIDVSGNIPFTSSNDIKLTITDTPGPNNARNPGHGVTQRKFLGKASKTLVIYVLQPPFDNSDEDNLLREIADSTKVGGKQSRDRFIFVLNKTDERRSEDGKLTDLIKKVRRGLQGLGIDNPNIFPVSALVALGVRMKRKGADLGSEEDDELIYKVNKLNKNTELHLEKYAVLPQKEEKVRIDKALETAIKMGDVQEQALVHSGILSLEAYISLYLEKYARTAKIKNVVDVFMREIEEVNYYEKLKSDILKRKEFRVGVERQCQEIEEKIKKLKGTKNQFESEFRSEIDDEIKVAGEKILDGRMKVQASLDSIIARIRERIKLTPDEARAELVQLKNEINCIETDYCAYIDGIIKDVLQKGGQNIISEYKRRVVDLVDNQIEGVAGELEISPFKMVKGKIKNLEDSLNDVITTEVIFESRTEIVGYKTVWCPHLFNPLTWLDFEERPVFGEKLVERDEHYVDASAFTQKYITPIESNFNDTSECAKKYIVEQSKKMEEVLLSKLGELDKVIEERTMMLKSLSKDIKNAQAQEEEINKNLQWLKCIQEEVDTILAI